MTPQPALPRRWPTALAALAALLVGGVAAVALTVAFTWYDDPCPGYDDEGTMAAPASPYANLMCEPTVTLVPSELNQIAVPGVVLVFAGLGLAAAAAVVWRRPGFTARRTVALALTGVLLVQPAVVLVLQYTLPRDCLSGRTDSGDCSRDRELR